MVFDSNNNYIGSYDEQTASDIEPKLMMYIYANEEPE